MSLHRLTFSIHYQDLLTLEISIDWGKTATDFSCRSINLAMEEHQTKCLRFFLSSCFFFFFALGRTSVQLPASTGPIMFLKNLVAGHLESVFNLHCALIGSEYKISFRCINMWRYNETKAYLSQLNFISNARKKKKKNGKFNTCDNNLEILHNLIMYFKTHN